MPQYQKHIKLGLRWFYKFDYQNITYRSNAIYLTKTEAKKAEAKRFDVVSKQVSNPDSRNNMLLIDAINERLDILQVKKSTKYYKESKHYLSTLLQYCVNYFDTDSIQLTQITAPILQPLLLNKSKELQESGKDNYAVNAMIRCYKALFNHAINTHDLEIKNPINKIDFFSVNLDFKYIPTDEELIQVLEICDREEKILVEFVYDTACRINEALRMTDKDVLPQTVVLYTRKSRKSNLVPRRIPRPSCLNELQPFKPNERIFNRWKSEPRFLEKKIKRLQFKRSWNWHNLRHKKASEWSKEGKPLYEIMNLLGHNQLDTTQKYLQLIE